MSAISRNDPCPCGSGKKYKKCCLDKQESAVRPPLTQRPVVVETDLDELSNRANDMIRAKRWEDAERICLRLKKEFPEELDADDRLAQLYQAQEHYAKALPYAQAALEKARRHPAKFDPELVADLEEQVAFIRSKAVP
jgi:tetratricopeptide (TPR) repeat protein